MIIIVLVSPGLFALPDKLFTYLLGIGQCVGAYNQKVSSERRIYADV